MPADSSFESRSPPSTAIFTNEAAYWRLSQKTRVVSYSLGGCERNTSIELRARNTCAPFVMHASGSLTTS